MKTIKIFPDYCSSGIWSEYGNMDVSQINIDKMTELALYYWHWMWEKWELDSSFPTHSWIEKHYAQWWEDGAVIAREIQKQNAQLFVVYDADCPDDLIEYYHKGEDSESTTTD